MDLARRENRAPGFRIRSIINLETAGRETRRALPGPRSSLTCSVHSTQCAMSKYGNIFSLMTWLAMSRKASGSIVDRAFSLSEFNLAKKRLSRRYSDGTDDAHSFPLSLFLARDSKRSVLPALYDAKRRAATSDVGPVTRLPSATVRYYRKRRPAGNQLPPSCLPLACFVVCY